MAPREDFKPHHCDIYQYLLLLPPQLLLCWSAFTHFFFSFFSAGISNFQPFHWHLLLSASNSTHFQGYPEQFHFIYILWKVSLTDSSLSSDLPFQSLKHKLLCYLAVLFSARILPKDKLLDSSQNRTGKVIFIQFYHMCCMKAGSTGCLNWAINFLSISVHLLICLRVVFICPMDKCHNSNNSLQALLISQLSHK